MLPYFVYKCGLRVFEFESIGNQVLLIVKDHPLAESFNALSSFIGDVKNIFLYFKKN